MSLFRSPALAMALAMLGVAAILGASLGAVTAANRPLSSGFNLIGGPVVGDVSPDKYVGCLPDGSWKAVYIWKTERQEWKHYFNTSSPDVPDFVNSIDAGGIEVVPYASGVIIFMAQDVSDAFFPDHEEHGCQ